MEKNRLIKIHGSIYRVLAVEEDGILLIDCMKRTMPRWYKLDETAGYEICTEKELLEVTQTVLVGEQDMSQNPGRQSMRGLL